jgi:hypothetical protein
MFAMWGACWLMSVSISGNTGQDFEFWPAAVSNAATWSMRRFFRIDPLLYIHRREAEQKAKRGKHVTECDASSAIRCPAALRLPINIR